MNALFATVVIALISGAAPQCSSTHNSNCVHFVRNGFCDNMGYTLAQRQATCGISCGLCDAAGRPIQAGVCSGDADANCANWARNGFCDSSEYSQAEKMAYCCKSCAASIAATDANVNCAAWAANTTNPFCVNTMTAAQKTLFCANTCAFEIKPTADCALYTVTGTTFARGATSNKAAAPGAAVASGVKTGTTLNRVFAKSGCTVKLFAVAAPPATNIGEAATFTGNSTSNFFPVAATNNGALSYTCVQYGRNGVHSSMVVPEMTTNGAVPKWTLPGLAASEYASIATNMNLVVSTRPVDASTTKLFDGYVEMGGGSDTTIVMSVRAPGYEMAFLIIADNEQPLLLHKCDTTTPSSNPEALKTVNVPYVGAGQFQVCFS
ncbi:hypothetical protein PRIPAC_97916 [Pristionchus pacificus]|uniref:ShK domain-containing protein n=1 Tax=Pristionchus pacificus TaxID=54126 RepID=A0A2A6B3E1_PRIPA|nr:hypothetical protein PRIPAC_97916 [Pristionchus pacificus]|eukprot:PDM60392.1 ShK domain-containing protein [Pristionchus pacificus]